MSIPGSSMGHGVPTAAELNAAQAAKKHFIGMPAPLGKKPHLQSK